MFCGLGEDQRKILRKKKRKKNRKIKRKKLIAAKNGLVGMKEYLKIYNHMKYFFRAYAVFE